MVDLLNKKIFLDKDEQLFRKIEQLAFQQGFVYAPHWNNDNTKTRCTNQKPIVRAKYQTVVFFEAIDGTKVISLNHYANIDKGISSYRTWKDRFDGIKSWDSTYYYKKCIIEALDPKLLTFEIIQELW